LVSNLCLWNSFFPSHINSSTSSHQPIASHHSWSLSEWLKNNKNGVLWFDWDFHSLFRDAAWAPGTSSIMNNVIDTHRWPWRPVGVWRG
jgi:hypothetical protein